MKRLLNITIRKDARYLVVGSVFTVTALWSCVLRLSGNADTIGQKQVMVELYVLENVPQRVQFLSHMSPMQGKQHLTEAGKWERWQAALHLAPSETTPHAPIFRVQPFELARAAFSIYLCFPLLCTDGICQFIGMVLNLLRRWIVTYKPDLL